MDTITNNTSEESIQVETSVSKEHNPATDTTTAGKYFAPSESIIAEPSRHGEFSAAETSTAGVPAIDGEVDGGVNTNDAELVSSSGAIDNNAGGEAGHLGGAIMGLLIMLVWRWRILNRYRNRQ